MPIIIQPYELFLSERVGDHPYMPIAVLDKRGDLPKFANGCLVAIRQNSEACFIEDTRYFIQLNVENIPIALLVTSDAPSEDQDLIPTHWSHCRFISRRENLLQVSNSEQLPLDILKATCQCLHVYSLHTVQVS